MGYVCLSGFFWQGEQVSVIRQQPLNAICGICVLSPLPSSCRLTLIAISVNSRYGVVEARGSAKGDACSLKTWHYEVAHIIDIYSFVVTAVHIIYNGRGVVVCSRLIPVQCDVITVSAY